MRAAQQKWREVPVSRESRDLPRIRRCLSIHARNPSRSISRGRWASRCRRRGARSTPCSIARRPCSASRRQPCRTMNCRPRKAFADSSVMSRSASCSTFPPGTIRLLIAVNVVIPALLAGNAVLIKHARLTPLCGDAFVDAFRKTKLPPDLVASIHVGHATVSSPHREAAPSISSRLPAPWKAAARSTGRPPGSCSTWAWS